MKKIVIIGGGISGLSAGCYAQMNGFRSEIFEMHSMPGGVCTSWKRGDYLFDHCLHWVLGSNKGTTLYPVFKDLGIADHIRFHYPEIFRSIHLGDREIHAYTNIDRLEQELLGHFPDEKRNIRKYSQTLRKYTRFNPPIDGDFGNFGVIDFIRLLPFMPSFLKLKNISIEDYLNRMFRQDDLKAFLFRLFPVRKLPAIMAVMPLGFMHRQEGGYPLKGSLHFARTIEKKYRDLGGTIHYHNRVKRILIEHDCTKGIELENGKTVPADVVVSACDGRTVIYEMLQGKYITKKIERYYGNPSLWPPLISISLGINRDFSHLPEINEFHLKEPVVIAGKEIHWFSFFHFCHDPAMAPSGKSVIKIQIETDYDYWKGLYETDRDVYEHEKSMILELYIELLNNQFPGVKEDIEETDIATPVTWERYTGNWRGSYQGWMPTVRTFGSTLPKKIPGLKNFYMTGQWVFPGGGVPMCMAQGRNLIRMIK